MTGRGKLAVGCPVHKEARCLNCTCRTDAVSDRLAAGCPVRKEARCLNCACREKGSHPT